ncbi:hypothetical protein Ait01nite_079230 [Actinoplanes italicus]|uniref:Ketosteroid isomerase-like protein n=1 Tax=Actinoplanes italicus TaxID=113567 RepID=A0A2T0JRY9_9ACTN|nr:ketosteroid isomerase-like protein [Actinoplanes italicus]GIE34878.1 hypothetical protein Ait01nite_079230 [Actinoplanes italicus]
MSERGGFHHHTLSRDTGPATHPAVFAEAFNSGDPAAVERCHESGAFLMPRPGVPVTGRDRSAANETLLALGLPIKVRPRHVYTADDIALLIVDWTIEGTGPDGEPVHIERTATDVARTEPGAT